jgi:hypothetical protein
MQPVPESVPMSAQDETVPKSWASQASSLTSDPAALKALASSMRRVIKFDSGYLSDTVTAVPL